MAAIDARPSTLERAKGKLARTALAAREYVCAQLALVEGAVGAALFFVVALTYHLGILGFTFGEFPAALYLALSFAVGAVYSGFAYSAYSKLLEGQRRFADTLTLSFYGWTIAFGVALLLAFMLGIAENVSRLSIALGYLGGIPLLVAARAILSRALAARITAGTLHFHKVAMVGRRVDVVDFLLSSEVWRHGGRLSAALYLEEAQKEDGDLDTAAVARFVDTLMKAGSDSVVFVGELKDIDANARLIDELRRYAINVDFAPSSFRRYKIFGVVRLGPNNALRIVRRPLDRMEVALKRAMDICGALFGLTLLSPLLLAVAILIRIESPGPAIFRQERRGFSGSTFSIWKFRSMQVLESDGVVLQAQRNDPRITRVGRFIRATSIDELPQLVNVLLGQMSLVGPRPHAVSHDRDFEARVADYAFRHRIKPGITGWAQVNGYRGETRTDSQVEGRNIHDLYYIDNWSLLLDVWIIILTVFSLRTHRNVF